MKIVLKKDGLTGEQLKTVEELEKRFAELPDSIQLEDANKEITKQLREAGIIGEDGKPVVDLAAVKEMLAEDGEKSLRSIIKKQGITIEALKEKKEPQDMSVRGQVKAWQEKNADAIKKVLSGQRATLEPFQLRVASPMTPANTYNSSAYLPQPEFEAGANDIVRVQPTFWDYLRKGRTSSAAYVWVNKKNPLGAAGFIGPGVAKPGISFEIDTEISNAKKVAASEKVAMEILDDIDGMTSWVLDELRYQVMIKTNATLMTGVASSTVPAGIQTLSVAYTATGVSTHSANNFDVLRAAAAQLRSGNLVGPITYFVNPIDKANMDMTKAISAGVYIDKGLPGPVVEDNNIPVGYFQAALLDYYRILIYQDFTVTWGWENDDFTKNLVTALGEMRLHQIFSENYTGAFIYDTFANVKTAINLGSPS